ncbi:MAG TPA: hypothetical protein VFJ07_24150 [Streptosporangiaceae bacterium]|nr:hypothetical protein [Streptosporangiaceae bacterium]
MSSLRPPRPHDRHWPARSPGTERYAALDAKNQRWVEAAHVLSPRVVTGLLHWSGEQAGQYYATVDLTERWVHQQHIRDAVGQPGDHGRFLPAVLATFAWAFPHQYRPAAAAGTAVQLDFGSGGRRAPGRTAAGNTGHHHLSPGATVTGSAPPARPSPPGCSRRG